MNNVLLPIVSPTMLQAQRESDGTFTAIVSEESHAPVYAYISASDYFNHEMNGLITIHMTEPKQNGFLLINYSVN